MELVILRLEGYLQSYGESSKWSFRDTSIMPTKSAVVGLIASGIGIPRGSSQLIELSKSIRIGVRADRQGKILKDFHTVTGQLINSNGRKLYTNKTKKTTRITERQYLQDSSFLVVIEAEGLIETIVKSLENPKWQIYLGRKNCIPSRPVLEEVTDKYETLEEAIMKYKLEERHDKGGIKYQIEQVDGNIVKYDETLSQVGHRYDRRNIVQGIIGEI